jgi:hypothetical protein
MAEQPPRLAQVPDAVLEQALADLGRDILFPPTPDLAGQVAAALRQDAQQPVPMRPRSSWQRWWLAAAALILLALGLLLFPEARDAIADRLGLPGVEIHWLEDQPTPAPVPDVSALQLGREVTLEEASAAVPFPVSVPTLADYASPPAVYLLGSGDRAMVSFVYPPTPDLPETSTPGVGALLTQFPGSTNRNFIRKGLYSDDGELATSLEIISVAGSDGFWIAGAPHTFFLACDAVGGEECREERYRLAGNVLLWEADGVVFRLESDLSREASLILAESVSVDDSAQAGTP